MDALVSAFVAAALAEWGDRTQLLVALLAARSGRPATVLVAFLVAAIVSNGIAAYVGTLIADTINIRAMTLMVALALLFAGVAGFIRRKPPSATAGRMPLLLAAILLCLAAELGDRTQFLTFALSGRFDAPGLAAGGATAGMLAAALPAAVLGARLQSLVPIRAIRLAGAALFLLVGFVVAINALQIA
jgi:MprA protease rhombosortase-interaction domain-containing protein